MTGKKKKIIIGAAILVVIIAIVITNISGGSKIEVEASRIERGKIEEVVSAPGEIHAMKEVNINSDIMGKVVELNVKEGDWVDRGEVLARLDSTEQFANYQRAISNVGSQRADYEFKKSQFERKKRLYEKGLISKENFENISTALEMAELNLENARMELERTKKILAKTTIKSPISGTVMNIEVEEGENVITGTMNNPGTVLLTVSNLDAMEMVADVNESEVPLVSVGDSARVMVEAFPDTVFIGKVYNIASMPKSSLAGQTGAVEFEIKISLPHHPGMLPGMSATTEIITDVKQDILKGPLQAIVTEKDKKGVFRIENGRAKFEEVKTGITEGSWAEISEGLEEGDTIISGPLKKLMKVVDGQEVSFKIKDEKEEKKEEVEDERSEEEKE